MRTIHHGIELDHYHLREKKEPYLAFLGRIAPMKGTHIAIQVAKRCGIPLKIAGEVQPLFRDYFESAVKPHIDGKNIEYVGEADLAGKNELLGNAMAMLFPIQWNEPFGLVMLEAMACGTPVLAFAGGAVEEIVREGVSGTICRTADQMVSAMRDVQKYRPREIRAYVAQSFSREVMAGKYAALYREVTTGDTGTLAGRSAQPLAA
jgi:glycosyltransferase involved in cell wall biosynthesis